MAAFPWVPSCFRPAIAIAALAVAGLPSSVASTITIDATQPGAAPTALPFAIGDRSPTGHVLSANSSYLTLDGQPWFPISGEFHYARYPAAEWEAELLKMKAGGINVVSTYVFWIHHEETEGHFNWTGRRDLGRFIDLCGRHGLKVWLRIGPWAHGEARNGGFPDWLVHSGAALRQDDPKYLAYVTRFFGEIGRQVHGKFWRDGGPIVGVQIENEYHPPAHGLEHMRTLRQDALEAGMTPAYFSATGWDRAVVPPTDFLPVFGGYTEQFWSASLEKLPPNQNFFFTPIRAEDNVMGDLTPKVASYNSQYDGFPFLTAEMGGGMSIAYHRRPLMAADDSTAAAVVKLGSGANGLGFYMYHGGTNPDGLTPLQETQAGWNGYNDMEVKSYDFQAPLGEFGQVNPTFRTVKTVNLFLQDFGATLAPMVARFPNEKPINRDDTQTPRVTARTRGDQAFVFINNYERNYPLGDKRDFQVMLRLPGGTVALPRQPTVVPEGAYPILPVNFDVGGVTLQYATAQLVCRLSNPDTLVFFAWPGLPPEFAFDTDAAPVLSAPKARLTRVGKVTYVDQLTPSTSTAIIVTPRAGAKPTRIVVLSRADALNLWKAPLAGQDRLLLSPAGLAFDGNRILLHSRTTADMRVALYPAVHDVTGFHHQAANGLFEEYVPDHPAAETVPSVSVVAVKPAGNPPPIRLSPAPRAVATEPEDRDFDAAAEYKISVAPLPAGADTRAFLQVSYVGDVARMYVDGRLDDDNFYKGTPWELALWRYTPEQLKAGLDLKILPLRRDAPIFLERNRRPVFGADAAIARLNQVKVIVEHAAEATVQ